MLYSYNVKETIVVKQPLAGYAFTFQLGLDGLTPELQEDGSVLLTDNSGEGCYYIPAPYMMDADMVDSDAVSYGLSQDKDGNWLLTVEADQNWIEDPARAFPVEIDPTLIDLTGKTKFTGTTCTENGSIASATTNIACGYHPDHGQMEVYYKFPELPKIPAGHTLVRAQAGLFQNDYRSYTDSYDGQIVLYMSQIQEAASLNSVTWAKRPAHNPILDFVVASVSTVDGMLYWDITPAAKTWYDDSTKNYGLAMTSNAGSSTKCRAWFSYDSQVAFIVSYRNTTGIEPYYTYQTMGAGNAGTAYIGDFSGYLTIAKNLVSYSSTVNPVSLDLVYNSSYAATYDDTNYDTGGWFGLNMHLGAGVTLSYLQQMESVKLQNDFNENNTSTYLKYTDGDGTIHYFSKDKNGVYRDEDGLGLKVTLDGGEDYTVSDDNGNQMIFKNSYLVRLRDANGNEIQIRYAKKDGTTLENYYPGDRYTDYRLTQIVQKNAGGSEITAATLSYSGSGWLQTVTDAAGTKYSIHYNDDHRLTEILKGDDVIAQYGPATRIPYFYDAEAHYGVAFTYSANKISSYYEITEPSTGNQPGAIVEIDRNANGQTIYRDYGADRAKSSDDILTYYTFDYAGRSVNAYTTDANHTLYGATNAVYSGIGSTDKANNRTVRTASIGMAAMNILQNNGTELSSPAWSFSGIVDGTNIVRKQEGPRTGQYAIKGWIKKGLTQTIGAARTESLAANTTYTFSGYVNTQQSTNYAGSGVYLRVSGNGVDQRSECLNYQTSGSVDDGWVRLSVTFTTKAAGTYTLGVYNHGAGPYFFADDFQLEQSSTPSNRNMLENGDIQLGGQCWTISQYCGFTTNIGLFSESAGARAIGLPGDAYSIRQGYQDVPVNKSGKTYVLSGWAKGVSVPDNENSSGVDPAEDLHKQFGLRAVLTYADGSTEYHYVPFNPDVTQWQFASLAIIPKKPTTVVKTIRVICAYERNENKAYFDNLSLMEEPAQTMTYDSDGNLTSVTTTGLKGETSSYQNGNLIKNVTGGNGTFTYTYDSKHNMTSVTNGVVTQANTYDSAGNITQTKLSGSSGAYLQTSASYTNGNNLLASVTDSSGQKVSYQYGDARSLMTGLPTKILDVNGNATTTSYTDFNRLDQKVFASSGKIQYNYSNGSLTGVTRTGAGKTQSLTLGRDSFGNQTSVRVGDILLASYEYGAGNGLLQKQTYGNNASVAYTYDNLGRIQKASYSSGRNLHYTYTGDGQVYSITDDNGTSATTDDLVCCYTYDSLGRVVDSRMCRGIQTLLQSHLTYDDCNRISSQAWQMGSQSYKESYTYSAKDGTLTGISSSGGGNSLTFTYDALERLSTVKNSLYTKSFGYKTLSGSQSTAQVEKIQYSGLKSALSSLSYSYTYDALGNIASMTPSVGYREAYIYDAMGQLTGAALGNNYYFYNYDPTGNLMSVQAAGTTNSYTYGNSSWVDLLTAYNGQAIAYEGQTVATDGSVSGTPISGNPVSYYNGSRWNLSWSEGRNLTSARSTGGNGQYTYDAGGVRTGRTVTKGPTTEKHSYIYASGKLLRDTVESGGSTKILDFRYDQSGAPYSLTYTVGSTSTVYYYITNLQGDVMYLVDSSGNQVAAYLYDPFGKVLSSSGTMAEINPLRYRGYYQDSETGFYYLQSRYYDPAICRFINADSYASTGQGLIGYNAFAYCINSPVDRSDFNGLLPSKIVAMVYFDKEPSQSLPKTGTPNSVQDLLNPDGTVKQRRWYDENGQALRDRDYNHAGNMDFPHDHAWENGKRNPKHMPPSPDFFMRDAKIVIGITMIMCGGATLFLMVRFEVGGR